jgi:TP901 family phage tail tape measure protein
LNITEIFRTRIEIDGQQSINEIGKLELQMKDLKAAIKSIAKESEEWKNLTKEAKNVEKQIIVTNKSIESLTVSLEVQKNKITQVTDKIKELSAAENKDEAQIKALNKELKTLENQYSFTEVKLNSQKAQLIGQTAALENVQKSLKQTTQHTAEYVAATAQLQTVETRLQEVRKETGLLGMTMNQLKSQQKEYNQALDNLTFGTEKYDEVFKKLQEINGVIAHQQNNLRDTRTGWQKFKDEIRGFGAAALGNIGGELAMRAFDGMTQALVGTVTQAAKLSDEIADMQRFLGLTTEEALNLNKELSALNTRTSTADLRGIAMIGGQLGVAKEEIVGFVDSIDKANVALSKEFGGNAEAVANALGKIKNLFADTKNMKFGEAMERIGSSITAAGASSSASAPQIADFVQRIGAIGELGPKLTESLGLGTTLLDLGLSSEIASSGLSSLFVQAGKESEAFAKQIGISVEEFKKLQNNDPNKMILDLAKSFKGLNNDEVLAGLLRMKISSNETIKVMALLKDNTDKVIATQKTMAEEFSDNVKLQEAFNVKMSTFGAQVDLAKKEINGLVAGITSALLPAMTKIIEVFVSFVVILKALPKFIDDNKYVILALAGAVLAFNKQLILTQVEALRTSFGLLQQRVALIAYNATMGLATISANGFAMSIRALLLTNPIGWILLLVGGLITLYNNSETVRNGVNGVANAFLKAGEIIWTVAKQITNLDFSKAFDTLKNGWDEVKKSFAEGATPVINKPVQAATEKSMLFSNDYKKQKKDEKLSLDNSGLTPLEKPETYEAPVDVEANKKRAAELAVADNEKNKKDRENLAKKNEERKKLTEQALKDLHDMELRMMEEGQAKETLLLEAKYSEMGKKIEENILKGLPKEIAQKQFELLYKDFDTEKEKITEKYRKLGIDNANTESEALIKTKKELQDKELAAVEANKANKDAKATLENLDNKNNLVEQSLATENPNDKVAINEEIIVADNLFKQNLLDNETWLVEQKLAIHAKYRTLTEEQERALQIKQQEIEAQKTQNTLAEAERRRIASQNEYKATLTAASGLVGALGNLQNAMGQDGESWVDFKNALTLAQIGIDTASAISSLTAASSANPTNAVTFGTAGAIQFATGVVSIMANVAKATSILSGTNKPKATASKAANSGSSGGGSSYFDGGHHREAAGYTGGSSIYEPIPFIGHGGEYIIPNWMMRQTPIANFAGILEGIRTNKASVNSLYSPNQGNKTYFDGGIMTNTNSQSVDNQQNAINIQFMQMINTLSDKVANTNANPAFVLATDISEALYQKKVLDEDTEF